MTQEAKPKEYLDLFKNPTPIVKDGNLTIVNYAAINFQQFLELPDKENALVVTPISPLEVHGKYLPLGSDYLEGFLALDWLKEALKIHRADKTFTIIQMPGIPIGTGTNRGHYATIHTSRKAFYEVVLKYLDSLVYAGFRKILLMSVHHGMIHAYALEEAANKIMKKYKRLGVRVLSPNHYIADTLFIRDPVEVFSRYVKQLGQEPLSQGEIEAINIDHHAGIMEIAFMKAIDEGLVDPSYKSAPRNVEKVDAQLKGLIMRKYAAHPPCEPDGCGYNADPTFADSRDWVSLFKVMITDIGLTYVDALYSQDPKELAPLVDMAPWKRSTQGNAGLEFARVMFLGANSTRNYLVLVVLILIAIPWVLYFLK